MPFITVKHLALDHYRKPTIKLETDTSVFDHVFQIAIDVNFRHHGVFVQLGISLKKLTFLLCFSLLVSMKDVNFSQLVSKL